MPGGEHRQIVVVEHLDRLGVVHLQLVVGYLVDPGSDDLAQQLAAGLATHGLGDDTYGFLGFDEAQGHVPEGTRRIRRNGGISQR